MTNSMQNQFNLCISIAFLLYGVGHFLVAVNVFGLASSCLAFFHCASQLLNNDSTNSYDFVKRMDLKACPHNAISCTQPFSNSLICK